MSKRKVQVKGFECGEEYEEDYYKSEYECKVIAMLPGRVHDLLEDMAHDNNITIGETVTEILKWWECKHA